MPRITYTGHDGRNYSDARVESSPDGLTLTLHFDDGAWWQEPIDAARHSAALNPSGKWAAALSALATAPAAE